MTLVPFARRLVANKARDKVADPAAAASSDGTPPPPNDPAPAAGELEAAVAEAQAMLAEAGEAPEMRRDPYRVALAGLSLTIGALPRTVRAWDEAVKDVIAARHPFTPEERAELASAVVEATTKGAYEGTRKEAARMIRRLDHGLAIRMGLCVGAAFVLGSALTVGAFATLGQGPFRPDVEGHPAWRELAQNNPDPRPALAAGEVRVERNTGRRYYAGVSLWLDPSRPPPPSASGKAQGSQ